MKLKRRFLKTREEIKKAVESTDIKNTPFLNKAGNKVKVGVFTLSGSKVCMDPTAPPVKKAIAGAKLVCCGSYAGANIIWTLSVVAAQAKIISSACCGLAWLGLSGLEYIEAKGNM